MIVPIKQNMFRLFFLEGLEALNRSLRDLKLMICKTDVWPKNKVVGNRWGIGWEGRGRSLEAIKRGFGQFGEGFRRQKKIDFGIMGAIDGDSLEPRIYQNQPKPNKTPESTNDQTKISESGTKFWSAQNPPKIPPNSVPGRRRRRRRRRRRPGNDHRR